MLKAYYQTSKILKSGKEVKQQRKLSRSFLKQYIMYVFSAWGGTSGFTTFTNTVGSSVSQNAVFNDGRYSTALAGYGGSVDNTMITYTTSSANYGDDYGIVIGSDDTAVDTLDYKLGLQIYHGSGTNQMEYLSGFSNGTPVVSHPNANFSFERLFLNSSSGQIGIKETGIYLPIDRYNNPATYGYFCFVRDVITTVLVDPGEYFKVKYTLQVTA
jgi:hypothetical protein